MFEYSIRYYEFRQVKYIMKIRKITWDINFKL